MEFKHIIFDFDGTIADTSRIILATMQATMRDRGLRVATRESIRKVIGVPLKDCFTHMYPDMSEIEALECARTYCDIFDANKSSLTPTLFPDVAKTLTKLNYHGITMSVASSRGNASLVELLEILKVRQYFTMVVGVDNVDKAKPNPEAVLYILKAMNVDTCETLMVGDMPVDIAMGKNANVKTCAVTYGNSSKKELEKSHPDYIIDNVDQLIDYVGLA
ncbi:MAG: HAD family hydrolase [Muribaculaceae bacterium]|nr:HAD family hydrolase [Muribaculaceae bacterium]